MNMLRAWPSAFWLAILGVASTVIWGLVVWLGHSEDGVFWVVTLLSVVALLAAWAWWSFSRHHLGAEPADLSAVTQMLAVGQHETAQALLEQGGQGAWGDLAKIVTNLQRAQLNHEQRAWRDQGLALIHETVRYDHTPKALADLVSLTLTRFLDLTACALYVLDSDLTGKRLHADCTLLQQGSSHAHLSGLPESVVCSFASLQALAASETILRNGEIPGVLLKDVRRHQDGDTVLVPLVMEMQVRGVLLMTAAHSLPNQLEALMEPVSAAIAVAMQSAKARETLQASLARANDLTKELQDQQEKLQDSEVALKKQMTYVNDILGNMHSGLVVVDRSGRIQDCNPALLKLTGFDRDLLIGQPSSLLFE